MSFAPGPLPVATSSGACSIWARRMMTKSVATSESKVELNILSLLLDVPLASLDEKDLVTCPVSLPSRSSPWAFTAASAGFSMSRSCSSLLAPTMQRCKSMDYLNQPDHLEMHTAQTAVRAALDVLQEPTLSCGPRISTSNNLDAGMGRACLTSPLSPASPVSSVESCFSGSETDGRRKGRARMSQEKRKRLARRREREALLAALCLPTQSALPDSCFSHSASSAGFAGFEGYQDFSTANSSQRSGMRFELSSPTLRNARACSALGSIGRPPSSPITPADSGVQCTSPPRLVVQPPSPQCIRLVGANNRPRIKHPTSSNAYALCNNSSHLASVY